MVRTRSRRGGLRLAALVALAATLPSACGSDPGQSASGASPSGTTSEMDLADLPDAVRIAPESRGAGRPTTRRIVAGTVFAPLPPSTPTPGGAPNGLRGLAGLADDAAAVAATSGNPLAGRPWGTYLGPSEAVSAPYAASSGETRSVLGYLANAPKATWFGAWIADEAIESVTRDYVAASQQGDPDTLVQLTDFRAVPWEAEACERLPSAAEQASYRTWTDAFARGIGDAHAAVVLQPDGPFALCTPGGVGVQTALVKYAAETLSALPNTSVYLEVGAADWPAEGQGGVPEVLKFLLPAGIESVRGIALNGTHYSATEDEVRRGAAIVQALAALGIEGKHVVINTSSNGHPFTYGAYRGSGRWAHPDNARPCTSPADPGTCVSLGIPPTAEVADPRWGLSAEAASLASTYVDGYLWFGRPWLYFQNSPFELDKALAVIRSSPYRS